MSVGDVFLAVILVLITYNVMRQIEQWLHRHIFKVGWLVTKNFRTTTILYYTFFLPGVFVNQFVSWLTAGLLDVRADRQIKWPEKQEVGELHLDFVKYSNKTSDWKRALIDIAPFVAGLALVLFIADNILDVGSAITTMEGGDVDSVSLGIQQLFSQSDFWLWAYLLFAISNTMNPDFSLLKKYSWLLLILGGVALAPLFFLGVGERVVGEALTGPVASILNALSTAFVIIIVFNFLALVILATVENSIEYITGDSATFKNGKMIVMTREEAIAEREKERKRAQRQRSRKTPAETGPPSVYKLSLPIPGSPGDESVTSLPTALLEPENTDDDTLRKPKREEPDTIIGQIKFNPSREEATDTGDDEIEADPQEEAEDTS